MNRFKANFRRRPFWTLSAVIGSGIFLVLIVLLVLAQDLPSLAVLERYDPALVSKVYSSDNQVIKEFYIRQRELISLEKIPVHMIDAVISTEDRRFYDHWGVDLRGIARALAVDLWHLRKKEGASTVTQQLAKQLYLSAEKSWIRKIREQLTAIQIERTYTKREILEMYLNNSLFGHGTYGVQAAARLFFGKTAEDLSLSECAVLTAVLRSPGGYSPFWHIDRTYKRRNQVLRNMLSWGYISKEEYNEAVASPINTVDRKTRAARNVAPYFTEYVRQKMYAKYKGRLFTDGMSIYTTLDSRVQAVAERAVEAHLPKLQKERNERLVREGKLRSFIPASELEKRTYKEILTDSAYVDSLLTARAAIQVALVAIDPSNGSILAMIGGRNFEESKFNRAVQAKRQPGSAFKPFLYTAALDNGYPPTYQIVNQPVRLRLPNGDVWIPGNYYRTEEGGWTTLREALRRSLNYVAARLVQEVGPDLVVRYAHEMGITSPLMPVYSIALGSNEVVPIELTSAFGSIGNRGVLVKPVPILRVVDKDGEILEEHFPESKEVLNEDTAYLMTDLLQTVMNHGTGVTARSVYGFNRPAAGKTGTTNNFTDAWFVGFTPDMVAGVWVGLDDPAMSLGPRKSGAVAALPIWARFMKAAHDTLELPYTNFKQPGGVVRLEICTESMKLANESCPDIVEEVFQERFAPTEHCDIHVGSRSGKFQSRDKRRKRKNF